MEKFTALLAGNPLFRGLGEDDISDILKRAYARTKRVQTDEYILRAGDSTSEMGFVLSGSALIIQEDLWGHRNIMNHIPKGDVFGEVFAAAPGTALNVSVVAHEDSEILFLDVNRLMKLLTTEAHGDTVIRNLISVLAIKTMAFNEKITHISRRSTREKLLSYLSSQALKTGSLSFSIAFNRQQLADYLCVERAAMSVELSKLQREGILSYKKNHFELKKSVDI